MKSGKRIISSVIIVFGVLLLIFGIVSPIIATDSSDTSVGIIGGAGLPTYGFLFLRLWGGACFASVAVGAAMIAAGILVLWMSKACENNMHQ